MKIKQDIQGQLKITLAFLMIFAGIIGGFLPILQGWVLILGGIILYRTTQEKDWRLPKWIDSRLPKKIKEIIYKDISLLRQDKKKQQKKI